MVDMSLLTMCSVLYTGQRFSIIIYIYIYIYIYIERERERERERVVSIICILVI